MHSYAPIHWHQWDKRKTHKRGVKYLAFTNRGDPSKPGPRRHWDVLFSSDFDVAMERDLGLEPGPGARTEARIPLAHREPAHVRHREASSSSGVRAVRPRVPEPSSPTMSYWSDEVHQVMFPGRKP